MFDRTETDFRIPAGRRVYAIGDIHGRADLLERLLGAIAADAATAATAPGIVFLGDYVDRGPDSRAVVDLVLDAVPAGFETVALMGNHEAMLRGFLDGDDGSTWLANGGDATLRSYGADDGFARFGWPDPDAARAALRGAIPARHRAFFGDLRASHAVGGYLFVHAGVRPGVPLAEQSTQDLMWIRGPFLADDSPHGKMIVHGHTVAPEPVVRANRIGIDTGAWRSGRLIALAIDGARRWFLSTGDEHKC